MPSNRSGFRDVRDKDSLAEHRDMAAGERSGNPFARGRRPARPNYDPDEGAAGGGDVWAVVLAVLAVGALVLGVGMLMAG